MCEICCPSARGGKIVKEKGNIRKSMKFSEEDDQRISSRQTFVVKDTLGDNEEDEGSSSDNVRPNPTETSFYYAKGKNHAEASDDSSVDDAETERQKSVLKDLKKLANRLEGPVQKHPSTGRGMFKKPQDRYIALVPDEELSEDASMFLKWKAGSLTWYESGKAFSTGSAAPKGSVPLMKIAKVDIYKDDKTGKSVNVKHKHNQEMHELVLVFATNRDAEEWSYALWEFISLIRGQSTAQPSGLQ